MRIDLGFDGGELLALDGTVVAEVEPQTLGRHDRSRLAHMRTQDSPERRMDEMRGGVIALDIAAPRFVDLGEGGRRLERLAKRADHRVPAVHLLDAFDRQLPPVTLDHTGVADLQAQHLRGERSGLRARRELPPAGEDRSAASLHLRPLGGRRGDRFGYRDRRWFRGFC